jgi:hypothetical protein
MPIHPTCSRRRVPRAGEPLTCLDDALTLVALSCHLPPQPETVLLFLDESNRGSTIVVVAHTPHADQVLDVVERFVSEAVLPPDVCGVVAASIRTDCHLLPGDLDRWTELDLLCDQHGVQLVDWVVIGPDGPVSPRAVLGEPSRW